METIQRATSEGSFGVENARRAALIGWGMVHGLVSLYIGGHMMGEIGSNEEFLDLVDEAMRSIYTGWRPDVARD